MDWSPEQISLWAKKYADKIFHVSHERIYQFIKADKRNGGILYIHCRHPKKYRKRGKKELRGHIKGRISIHERSPEVHAKTRLGDWEIDTVIGKNHKGALVTSIAKGAARYCC
ncbi:MAG: IS30 family transposase [Cetobacterium sp.]